MEDIHYWGMMIGVAFMFPFLFKFRYCLYRGVTLQELKESHREIVLALIGLSIFILTNLLFG